MSLGLRHFTGKSHKGSGVVQGFTTGKTYSFHLSSSSIRDPACGFGSLTGL
jgi:hypothetical protein